MSTPRGRHTATLLPSGKVLISGGVNSAGSLATAELFDELTNTFSPVGSMTAPRCAHTATLLLSGKVLITGIDCVTFQSMSAELFDPELGAFFSTGQPNFARFEHTATQLVSGDVLLIGGYDDRLQIVSDAEQYDVTNGTFSISASLNQPRTGHTATLLYPFGLARR